MAKGWVPDVMIGREEKYLGGSMSTIYRRFKNSPLFEVRTLPMQGKRKLMGTKKHTEGKRIIERLTILIECIPHTKVSSAI